MRFSEYLTQKGLEHQEPRLEKLAAAIRDTEHDEEFFVKTAGPITSMLWTAGKKLATSDVAKPPIAPPTAAPFRAEESL